MTRKSREFTTKLGVALFISLPILIVGILYLSFGGYRRIPPVGWVGVSMMLVTGVFLVAVILIS